MRKVIVVVTAGGLLPFAVAHNLATQPVLAQSGESAMCALQYDVPGVRCGSIERERPGQDPARIAWLQVPSRAESAGDPLVYVAGGPGAPLLARTSLVEALARFLSGERSLILYDQRGVGLSKPSYVCEDLARREREIRAANIEAGDAHDRRATAASRCARDLRDRGDPLESLSLAESVEDLDALRRALGAEQWNLLGTSYGGLLVQAYVARYPERVRAAVLNRPGFGGFALYHEMANWYEHSLRKLEERCTPGPCLNGIIGAAIQAYESLREPWAVPVDRGVVGLDEFIVNSVDFVELLHGLLYDEASLPYIPRIVAAFQNREEYPVARLIERQYGGDPGWSAGVTFSIICREAATTRDPELWTARSAEALPPFRDIGDWTLPCRDWHRNTLPPTELGPAPATTPVLVVSGEYDPVSPPMAGAVLASGYNQGQHVELRRGSHVSGFATGLCYFSLVRQFLADPGGFAKPDCLARIPPLEFSSELPAWARAP